MTDFQQCLSAAFLDYLRVPRTRPRCLVALQLLSATPATWHFRLVGPTVFSFSLLQRYVD
jgi:hypothetical protein